jgi:hypothetical protein
MEMRMLRKKSTKQFGFRSADEKLGSQGAKGKSWSPGQLVVGSFRFGV